MERKLSIKNGVITEEDEQVIDEFLEDVAKMNLHNFGIQTISKAFEKPCVRYECKDPIEEVKKDIITWFETYLATLDWNLDGAVEGAMKMKHSEKCKVVKALYNFTEISVNPELLDQIENGVKNVPTICKDGVGVVKQSLKAVLNQLEIYRRVEQKESSINQRKVKNWLEVAINEEEEDDVNEHVNYYKHVRNNLDKAMKIIKWNCDISHCQLTDKSIDKAVDTPGGMFVLADKNFGIALLPIETVAKAEEDMLVELKAKQLDMNTDEVIEEVEKKI